MTPSQFCEQCGGLLGDGVAFCESCGAAVPRDEPAPPAPEPVVSVTEPFPAAPVVAAAPTAAAPTGSTGSTGRGSPRWVPLAILVVGILVIVASIVSSL